MRLVHLGIGLLSSCSLDTYGLTSPAPTAGDTASDTFMATSTGGLSTGVEATSSSTADASTTADTTLVSTGDGATLDATAGLSCEPADPADSEDDPIQLDDITDDDDEYLLVSGALEGTGDADWYQYRGIDTFGHYVDPTVQFLSMEAGMRVCQFVECEESGIVKTNVTCPAGTVTALSAGLRPGCCDSAGFAIESVECGQTENLLVRIRLDKPETDTCVDYELRVHL